MSPPLVRPVGSADPPPGTEAASKALAALGVPALGVLVLVPLRWDPTQVVADPVLAVATLLSAVTTLLLVWNLLCMVAAHLATATLLPAPVTRVLASAVRRVGTRGARRILATRGAAAALGTGLLLSASPLAWGDSVEAGDTAPGVATSTPAGHPDPADGSSPTPLPPEDLTWGAPRGGGTEAGGRTTGTVAPATAPEGGDTHVVLPGESLWSIARDHLSPDAGVGDIAELWPRIHTANREVLGENADLIHPGTHLEIPGDLP